MLIIMKMLNNTLMIALAATASFSVYAKPSSMVWIDANSYQMGGDSEHARADELPKHKVILDGYWIDQTEVTNQQFNQFIKV